MRRAQPGERRDEVDALVRVERARECFGLVGAPDDAQPVAEPLYGRTRDEDGAFERVLRRFSLQLPRDGRQKPRAADDGRGTCVHQEERAGAVSVLRRARRVTALPEERRLLVAGQPRDRHARAEEGGRVSVSVDE